MRLTVEVPVYPNVKNPPRLREEAKLMRHVQNYVGDGVIVDFGCGTSYYTDGYAVGVDLDKTLLKQARLKHKVLADYHHAPFRNSVIAAVVMCHSLEHTNLPSKPLREAHRILKQRGVIGVSVPNAYGFRALYLLFFKQELMTVAPDHLTSFTPKILELLLNKCGFNVLRRTGDILYMPLMKRLRLMKFGYFLADVFSRFSNVYVVIGRKC